MLYKPGRSWYRCHVFSIQISFKIDHWLLCHFLSTFFWRGRNCDGSLKCVRGEMGEYEVIWDRDRHIVCRPVAAVCGAGQSLQQLDIRLSQLPPGWIFWRMVGEPSCLVLGSANRKYLQGEIWHKVCCYFLINWKTLAMVWRHTLTPRNHQHVRLEHETWWGNTILAVGNECLALWLS